jgi:hypothetical protein
VIETNRAFEVRNLQMDVPNADIRVNCHHSKLALCD